jgi:chromosome segregation ATPase
MSAIEERLDDAASDVFNDEFGRALDDHRRRAQDLLEQQRQRLQRFEQSLDQRLQQISEELSRELAASGQDGNAQDHQAKALRERSEELSRVKRELADQQQSWWKTQGESSDRQQALLDELKQQLARVDQERSKLEERHAQVQQRQAELERREAELEARERETEQFAERFKQREQEIDALRKQLEAGRDDLDARRKQCDEDRQQLEQQWKQREEDRERLHAERQEHHAEAQAALEAERAEWEAQHARLQEQQQRLEQRETEIEQLQQTLEEASRERDADAAEIEQQRKELAQRQADTSAQRRRIASELRAKRAELLAEIEKRRAELVQLSAGEDSQLNQQLAQTLVECDRLRDDLLRRDRRCDELTGQIEDLRRQIDDRKRDYEEQRGQWESQRAEWQKQQQTWKEEQARWEEQQGQWSQERAELAQQHASDGESAAQRLAKELEEVRADAESQVKVLEVSLAQARGDQEELREQLSGSRQQSEERGREIAQLKQRLDELAAQSAAGSADPALAEELDSLRAEREELLGRLDDAQQQLKQAQSAKGGKAGGAEVEDLKRRVELAMEEVRELKAEKNKLHQQLQSAQKIAAAAGGAVAGGPAMDWEAQKQRLLAQLESDFDTNDQQQAKDKLTVKNAIAATEQALSEKDQEIEDLKQLLNSQSGNIGEMAVGAHAIAEVLDQDALIREERENLRTMQEEWREKLRKAEVDISVERATIARERSELEEKIQVLESERKRFEEVGGSSQSDEKGKKSNARRWLTRLGLKENEE